MNYKHLESIYPELLKRLEEDGYSSDYREKIDRMARCILDEGPRQGWTAYDDVMRSYESREISAESIEQYRVFIRVIGRFEEEGKLPIRRKVSLLWESRRFFALSEEYRDLLYVFREDAEARSLSEKSVRNYTSGTICFLEAMQKRDRTTLMEITEDDVLSFFFDPVTHERIRNETGPVRATFRSGLSWKEAECRRILNWLPRTKRVRKNIPYLTEDELEKVNGVVKDVSGPLTLRERAIGTLLLHTPMRASDVASLLLADIDWEQDTIAVLQPKTDYKIQLPLSATVGNAIYDYLVHERPETDDPHLFVTVERPWRGISRGLVIHIAGNIYDAAGIRMQEGNRRGTHLFRHRAVRTMLEEGVPRPVISATLGHQNPASLNPYLNTDFAHLKKCALDIDIFPLGENVPL